MKFALLIAALLAPLSASAQGFCGNEAGGYALEQFQHNEGRGLSDPMFVTSQLVSKPNRGDRTEIWKVLVGKSENGRTIASSIYEVRVDGVSCALLSLKRR